MGISRVGFLASLAFALVLVLPAEALGAPRYAAPTPTGSQDCSTPQNACSLTTAVNSASSGDHVVALPGSYALSSTLSPPAGVSIAGQAGSRPVIDMTGSGSLGTFAANGPTTVTVENLDLESSGSSNELAALSGTRVSHLIVDLDTSTANSGAVNMGPSSEIADTVVRSSGDTDNPGIVVTGAPTPSTTALVNDTVYATEVSGVAIDVKSACASTFSFQADASIEDVIAHGDGLAIESSFSASSCTPPSSVVSVSYSNYNSTSSGVTDDGHNQTDAASTNASSVFAADPSNLHERAGSSTIDAGSSAGIESTDLDGNPRQVGAAPDIGAYEFVPSQTNTGPPTTRCVVPKLKGKTLRKARKVLTAAHCTLGKVKKPKHAKGKLIVKSQSASAGTVLSNDTRVSVKLRPKPHHKKR